MTFVKIQTQPLPTQILASPITPKLPMFSLIFSKEKLCYPAFTLFPKWKARGHLQKCVFQYMQILTLHETPYFTSQLQQEPLLMHPGLGRLPAQGP